MKSKLILIGICTVILLSLLGCEAKTNYSFDDPNIVAYVNGEAVFQPAMNEYIDMAKLFWKAERDLGMPDMDTDSADYGAAMAMYESSMTLAESYCNLDDEGWEKDYYTTLLIKKALYSIDPIEDNIADGVEQEVAEVKRSEEIVLMNGSVDATSLIQPVADKYNLTYEDCLDTVYRDFMTRLYERQTLLFDCPGYKGEKVKFNGSNAEEYAKGVKELNVQFNAYLDGLMDKAEIVKRSE